MLLTLSYWFYYSSSYFLSVPEPVLFKKHSNRDSCTISSLAKSCSYVIVDEKTRLSFSAHEVTYFTHFDGDTETKVLVNQHFRNYDNQTAIAIWLQNLNKRKCEEGISPSRFPCYLNTLFTLPYNDSTTILAAILNTVANLALRRKLVSQFLPTAPNLQQKLLYGVHQVLAGEKRYFQIGLNLKLTSVLPEDYEIKERVSAGFCYYATDEIWNQKLLSPFVKISAPNLTIRCIPSFIIVGVHKASTTAIRIALGLHPNVRVVTPFLYESRTLLQHDRSIWRSFLSQNAIGAGDFALNTRAVMEKNPIYFIGKTTSQKLSKIDGIKLVLFLRDPAEVIFSGMWMHCKLRGKTDCSNELFLSTFQKEFLNSSRVRLQARDNIFYSFRNSLFIYRMFYLNQVGIKLLILIRISC